MSFAVTWCGHRLHVRVTHDRRDHLPMVSANRRAALAAAKS
ncbi:hypothetical protein IXO1088_002490 [Xanthomonas oryzae pv. oryzae]|nr:hypothetical protein GKO49_13375 [Xanthomonas oryzae pv. oryzae]QIE17840.1 hypothetical protein IXO1088_002490 [Xanthomonas oryzae pv. oryzae]RBJ69810.1 hypothetical protein BRN90_03585 [Xanthomonas oryzae pv. oryzae]